MRSIRIPKVQGERRGRDALRIGGARRGVRFRHRVNGNAAAALEIVPRITDVEARALPAGEGARSQGDVFPVHRARAGDADRSAIGAVEIGREQVGSVAGIVVGPERAPMGETHGNARAFRDPGTLESAGQLDDRSGRAGLPQQEGEEHGK